MTDFIVYMILVVAIVMGAMCVAGVPAAILAWWYNHRRRRVEAEKAAKERLFQDWLRRGGRERWIAANRERGITANAERLIAETENYLRAWTEEEMS